MYAGHAGHAKLPFPGIPSAQSRPTPTLEKPRHPQDPIACPCVAPRVGFVGRGTALVRVASPTGGGASPQRGGRGAWGTVGRRGGPRAWGVIFRVGGRGGIPTWANVGRPMTWVQYYATPRRGTWANVGPRGTSHDFVTLVGDTERTDPATSNF